MTLIGHRSTFQARSALALVARVYPRTVLAILSLLLLAPWAFGAGKAETPWHVMMLFDENSDLRALEIIEQNLEETILASATRRVEFYHEYLDASRFESSSHLKLFADYLKAKYGRVKLDVIVPIIGARVDWASSIPRELFPDVPIVLASCLTGDTKQMQPVSEMTGIMLQIDIAQALKVALAVRPRTQRVVVISGPAAMYAKLLGDTKAAAKSYSGVTFEYWTERTTAQILDSAAALPRDSLVFYLELFRDSAGAAFSPWQFGQLLAKAANAPVFGIYESYLGTGIVGGAVVDWGFLGHEAGRRVLRVLNGESVSAIPVMGTPSAVPIFDWRAMERWSIRDSDLPPGSIVRFRPPSVWDAYRVHLLIVAAVVILQMVMIAVLLMQRVQRRRAEEALRQIEERLALAADSAQAGLWSLDLNTEEFWMTSETREIYGFAPQEDISFEQFVQVVHPDDRESVRSIVRQAVESGEGAQVEYRVVLHDDSVRWICSRGRAHSKKSGTPACLMGVSIDVTERKVSEQALRKQKQFTETLINSLPGIFYLYDHEWKMVRWNRNHELLTGFSADELKGRMVLDWFSEDFKDTIADTVRQVFQEGDATVEAPLTIKDGRQIPYLFKGVRLEIAGELYFWGMGIDISQRKANEEALKRSEQQLRLITDSLPAMIAYIDSERRYIFVNKSYANFAGIPRDQILGKEIREVLDEDAYEVIREQVETALSGQPVTFEITRPFSGLALRHMLAIYVPDIREGEIHGFFASIHDVTDLEKAKKQARDARETLYHFGRVKMLEALSSSLSHEMQQPLTGVLSNAQAAEMLLENPQSNMDEIRVIVKDIVADTKRAGKVMWQLRAFLRKQDTDLQLLNINRLIEDILSVLNSDMVIHNVIVKKDFAANLSQVVGDDIQLKQVLINLIMNAQQAMDDFVGKVHRMVIRTSLDCTGKITVGIEDSGPGIEEVELEHIFEPFFTTRQEGTGMGLAISQFIIEAHGGQMWAENLAEGGARICFSLPVAEGSPDS